MFKAGDKVRRGSVMGVVVSVFQAGNPHTTWVLGTTNSWTVDYFCDVDMIAKEKK